MSDLREQACDFELMQAIRILERTSGARLGGEGSAQSEDIRLRPAASMGFAPADVEEVDEVEVQGRRRLRLSARLLGLYGATSPLPTAYSDWIAQADPDRNRVRDFLDLFHHRLFSLLYRSWARYRYTVEFAPGGADPISRRLLLWLGADERMAAELDMQKVQLLRYASVLAGRHRSARAMEIVWADLLGVPLRIEQNIGRWVRIPKAQEARLGRARLGVDCVVGQRVHDRSGKFRIVIGPIDSEAFRSFLPGQAGRRRLEAAVRASLSQALDYEIELLLDPGSRPSLHLGTAAPARLGWTSWLGSSQGHTMVRFQGEL